MAKVSPTLQRLIDDGLFKRLPPTFAAYSLDRVENRRNLFPAERDGFERLFAAPARSEDAAVERLFAPLFAVERKLGVGGATWNRKQLTLGQVDFLERNRHLAEWRETTARIFAEIDPLLDAEPARRGYRLLQRLASGKAGLGASPQAAPLHWSRGSAARRIGRLRPRFTAS